MKSRTFWRLWATFGACSIGRSATMVKRGKNRCCFSWNLPAVTIIFINVWGGFVWWRASQPWAIGCFKVENASKWVTGVVEWTWPTAGGGTHNMLSATMWTVSLCSSNKVPRIVFLYSISHLSPITNALQNKWKRNHRRVVINVSFNNKYYYIVLHRANVFFFSSLRTWLTPLHINGCLRKSPVSKRIINRLNLL